MAGRRVKQTIQESFSTEQFTIALAGMSNVYSGYVTTFEEYQKQRYEARNPGQAVCTWNGLSLPIAS